MLPLPGTLWARNRPAMLFDNPPANGQADAGAFVHVAGMQALENAENPRTVFLVEADAVVFYDDTALFVRERLEFAIFPRMNIAAGYFDHRRLVDAMELQSVADQILK